MKETARVPLDRTPRALDLSPDGRRLYFTVAGLAAVQIFDTATNRVVGQIPVGASPHQAPFTPDGRWALVPSQGPGELGIIDAASGMVAGTVTVGKTPHWVATTSDGKLAYVSNEGSNDVSVVDLTARTVIATIPVGNGPRKIAVQPQSARGSSSTTEIEFSVIPYESDREGALWLAVLDWLHPERLLEAERRRRSPRGLDVRVEAKEVVGVVLLF